MGTKASDRVGHHCKENPVMSSHLCQPHLNCSHLYRPHTYICRPGHHLAFNEWKVEVTLRRRKGSCQIVCEGVGHVRGRSAPCLMHRFHPWPSSPHVADDLSLTPVYSNTGTPVALSMTAHLITGGKHQ